jgi:hypothetical protein
MPDGNRGEDLFVGDESAEPPPAARKQGRLRRLFGG